MKSGTTEADLARGLEQVLGAVDGFDRPVRVVGLRRLSGGASRETWSFVADGRNLIVQRVRPGLAMGGPSSAVEDHLLVAAARAGVPVPEVVADAAACTAMLGDARITAHVGGETLGPRIVRDERFAPARKVLAVQCAEALAAIHSIDPDTVTATLASTAREVAPQPGAAGVAGDPPEGLAPVDTLGRIREGLDLLDEARPAFELALRWLQDHRPPERTVAVVHGDFRVGNLIVGEDGLRAVLDWELAHLGDPLEDLGWLCVRAWRFGG
ncbi:MAG: phosphotransferase family protein, partial [Acidimicrobiales bacterium]